MALDRLPSSATPAEVAARIDRDGYAILTLLSA